MRQRIKRVIVIGFVFCLLMGFVQVSEPHGTASAATKGYTYKVVNKRIKVNGKKVDYYNKWIRLSGKTAAIKKLNKKIEKMSKEFRKQVSYGDNDKYHYEQGVSYYSKKYLSVGVWYGYDSFGYGLTGSYEYVFNIKTGKRISDVRKLIATKSIKTIRKKLIKSAKKQGYYGNGITVIKKLKWKDLKNQFWLTKKGKVVIGFNKYAFGGVWNLGLEATFARKKSSSSKRVYRGIVASKIYQDGRNVYYSFSSVGEIIRYNTKTKKKTLIRGSDGGDYGYGSLIVRGKYIYAIWGEWSGAYLSPNDSIYRITNDGKKRKRLKKGVWYDSGFVMAGSRLFYTNSKMEYDSDFGEEFANKGSKASMKLNGTDRRSASGVKIKKSKLSAGNTKNGNRKIVTGNSVYIISKNEKQLRRGNRVVFKCKKKETIMSVDAHKSAVMVTVYGGAKNGIGILKVYYVNKNGKNKKYIGSYSPAG